MSLLNKKGIIKFTLLILILTFIIGNISSVFAMEINEKNKINSIKSNDKSNNQLKTNNDNSKNVKTKIKSTTHSKKKLKIITSNLNKKYGDSKKFQVKITNKGKGVPNLKICLTLNSKKYYKTTDKEGIAKLGTSKLKMGKYKIKSVIHKNSKYYSNTNTNKITVSSQNPYKISILKWGSKGNIYKNSVLIKNIPKTRLSTKIINLCKKGTPLIKFGNGSGKKVFIVSGVHGNELSSQAATFKLINNIYKSKTKIKGTIYIIPILSPKTTSSNQRYYNKVNLNSVANKKGTLSYKLVNYAKSKNVDAVGDFHCTRPGGEPGKNIAMGTYLPCESSAILAKYISKKTKNPYLIYDYAGTEYPGAVEDALNLKNITSVTCEVISPHGKIKNGSILKSYKMMKAFLKYFKI